MATGRACCVSEMCYTPRARERSRLNLCSFATINGLPKDSREIEDFDDKGFGLVVVSCDFREREMSISVVHFTLVVDRLRLDGSDVDEWCPLETQTGGCRPS